LRQTAKKLSVLVDEGRKPNHVSLSRCRETCGSRHPATP